MRADGTFHPFPQFTAERASPETILDEVKAQLRHLRSLGVPVEYIDTHMGFAWIPGVRERLENLAREEALVWHDGNGFPSLNPPTDSDPPPGPAAVLEHMEKRSLVRAVWVFHPNARDSISESFHLVGEESSDAVARQREEEYRLVTNPAWVKPFLRDPRLRLCTYPEARNRGATARAQ